MVFSGVLPSTRLAYVARDELVLLVRNSLLYDNLGLSCCRTVYYLPLFWD
jgi:hypothetical protein